jgi:hypothetical protein
MLILTHNFLDLLTTVLDDLLYGEHLLRLSYSSGCLLMITSSPIKSGIDLFLLLDPCGSIFYF